MKRIKINKIVSSGLILLFVTVLILPFAQIAYAAAILNASDTLSSSKVSTLSNHTIVFRNPTAVNASTDTITITFPAGFTMGTFALLNFDLGASAGGQANCTAPSYTEKTLATAAAAGTWGAAQAAQVVTLTAPTDAGATEIAANACIRVRIGDNAVTGGAGANQITNPSTAASYAITIGGTFGDSGDMTVTILTDDQVAVSSTVSQSMSFSLGATSLALGTLSTSAVVSGSHTVTVATNAAGGMVLTYSGTTLTSGSNTITAMSTAAASSVGTEQFGINAKDNVTPNVGAECSGTSPIAAAATGYSTIDSFKFVTGETIISSSAGINSTTCTISYIANIAGSTEAGSYTTTLTYTATATF